ncbi:hypothetical protein CLOM_g16142, partial [Closterium sp. NIES-68]
LGLMRSFGGFA